MSIRAEFKEEKNSDFENFINDYWHNEVLTIDIFNKEICYARHDYEQRILYRPSSTAGVFTLISGDGRGNDFE
jgi:hypothetical protein